MQPKFGFRKVFMTMVGLFTFAFVVLFFYFLADARDPATIQAIGALIFPLGATITGLLLVFTGTNTAVHIFGKPDNDAK